MAFDEKKLRKYLACYGSDVDAWPEEARALGRKAQRHSTLAATFEEERLFETLLRKRGDAPARPDLAHRIIAAAMTKEQFRQPEWWLYDMLSQMKPAAIAATLVLGFAIGFGAIAPSFHTSQEAYMQPIADDDGALL